MNQANRELRPRWLHIGFGAFARAHVLAALDLGRKAEGADWGAIVARLSSGVDQLNALDSAHGDYCVAKIDDDGIDIQTVRSIIATSHPKRDGDDALSEWIAQPEMALITLTITEKGYRDGPAMAALVKGLLRRKNADLNGLTILSCDNLSDNGSLTRQAVEKACRDHEALWSWVKRECTFPSSMVDRIVPAMTAVSHQELATLLGRDDPNGIICEPFFQWVIEDRFAGPRPPLDKAGVQWVDDIEPWEAMKLRMLNGSHTFLALLGRIAGHDTIDECMRDSVFADAVYQLMLQEAAPTLPPLPDADLPGYAAMLVKRFRNTRLAHRTEQIATDTSQKLPQRLLAPIAWNIEHNRDWRLSALAVAGWAVWLQGLDDQRQPLPLNDPLRDTLKSLVTTSDSSHYIDNLLGLDAVFPEDLAQTGAFVGLVKASYNKIQTLGARGAIAETLGEKVPS